MKTQMAERTVLFSEQDAELLPKEKFAENEVVVRLFRQYAPHLRNIVRRVLAARLRNIFDPEDLLQEIAVILLAKPIPARISTPADFARYVGGMAKNIALALNRKHLDGRHHSLNHEIPLVALLENDTPLSAQPNPVDLVEDKEAVANLYEWLPARVQVIVMGVCAGFSVAEVASFFDIEAETVILFVRAANNGGPHSERMISRDDALGFFKPSSRRGRPKSIALTC